MNNKSTTSSKGAQNNKGKKVIDNKPVRSSLPNTRSSLPSAGVDIYGIGSPKNRVITPEYLRQIIPIMRVLMMQNEDVGQAIHNIVTLGNTGHKIYFDTKVAPDQVDAMRDHLNNKRTDWASGQPGMDGLVNRLITQILLGGALSAEAVPNADLTGIESVILVNPEEIEFGLDARKTRYLPYQRVKNGMNLKGKQIDLVPLNINTYKYFALNGDGDTPYGFPPYMNVLPRINTQGKMNKNIDYVVDQMGLMGFIETLIQKPEMNDDEDEGGFEKRLDSILALAKTRMLSGFKEGVVVGFKDDHEFKFNSASKSYTDAVALYENNELQIASGLKQDASLWGRAYATSETQITVVFVKMLSELRNIHILLKAFIEFVYRLELTLAGFNFSRLKVEFNRSTIQDELKAQQAEEIKVRNIKDKMIMGIINMDTAADELGYDKPSSPKPMVPWDVLAGQKDPASFGGTAQPGTNAGSKKKKSETKKRQQKKILPK